MRPEPKTPTAADRPQALLSIVLGLCPALIAGNLLLDPPASYAQTPPQAAAETEAAPQTGRGPAPSGEGSPAAELLHVPVSNLYPGTTPPRIAVTNPNGNDPDAVQRGRQDFIQFNCVGCHAANGAGGMGPALSNHKWMLYGSEPAQIFLTITQGRPKGMPAWGQVLPSNVIWDLVSYIKSISAAPTPEWGKTVSIAQFKQTQEQVPAEKLQSTEPWQHTEPFSFGMKPDSDAKKSAIQLQPEQ